MRTAGTVDKSDLHKHPDPLCLLAFRSLLASEKDPESHLKHGHTDTEAKISGQARELVQVSDQQYSDIQKLRQSRQRKR